MQYAEVLFAFSDGGQKFWIHCYFTRRSLTKLLWPARQNHFYSRSTWWTTLEVANMYTTYRKVKPGFTSNTSTSTSIRDLCQVKNESNTNIRSKERHSLGLSSWCSEYGSQHAQTSDVIATFSLVIQKAMHAIKKQKTKLLWVKDIFKERKSQRDFNNFFRSWILKLLTFFAYYLGNFSSKFVMSYAIFVSQQKATFTWVKTGMSALIGQVLRISLCLSCTPFSHSTTCMQTQVQAPCACAYACVEAIFTMK